MRPLLLLLAALSAAPASAERLTLDRLHADPALAGPGVRALRVSPDGERVTFLRGRADNQFQLDLWEYNMKDKTTHRLVDSKKLVPNENLSLEERARRERAAWCLACLLLGVPALLSLAVLRPRVPARAANPAGAEASAPA